MSKLLYERLEPYAGYGLKMMFEKSGRIITLAGITHVGNNLMIYQEDDGIGYLADIWNFKPLMHPMTDIIKEVTKGESTFVPMAILYEDAIRDIFGYCPSYTATYTREGDYNFGMQIVDTSDGLKRSFELFTPSDGKQQFEFKLEFHGKYLMINQIRLLKRLYKWHFACDIPENGFIDINILR